MNTLIVISAFLLVFKLVLSHDTCDINEIFVMKRNVCEIRIKDQNDDPIYITYSVNSVEGFNLRRDVYLRMAIFIKQLRKIKGYRNTHLGNLN